MSPLEALQATLAAEHAAVYVYGVLGGRVPTSREPGLASQLSAAYTAHRGRRDQLTAMIRAAGGQPVAAEVGYVLPDDPTTPAQLSLVARGTEERSARVYAQTVGSTSRGDRQWAVDALSDAAVRQLAFGGRPTAFPGAPEL